MPVLGDHRYLVGPRYRNRNALSTLVVALLWCVACGSGGATPAAPSPAPAPIAAPAPSPAPAPAPGPEPVPLTGTVTITSSGVSPAEIAVALGGRVVFVNTDVIPHDISGGPDPAHPDCLEINAAGFLTPGQSRATAPLPTARTCDYHDHAHSAYVTGRIVIR
jgi:plastocyanin